MASVVNPGWIAYVGPFYFPWGQPGSRRVYGIAQSLAEGGQKVSVGCGTAEPRELIHVDNSRGGGNISYIGLGELPPPSASVASKLVQLLVYQGVRTVDWLDAQPIKPSHVILYGGYAQYMFRLLPWCRRQRVSLIVDVVEWYDARQLNGGFFGPFHISAKVALHIQFAKSDGIIAISSYLADYYRQRGCPVIRIPPTLDTVEVQVRPPSAARSSDELTLVYAGTPGKKDLLENVIRGVMMADPKGERLRLVVLGPTIEQVQSLRGGKVLPSFVQVLGRVPQQDVGKIVRESDFSVLLREPLRFTQAGFPTKFVESVANGTPVIANITSDLGHYLRDSIEGLVAQDHSAEAFAAALGRALRLKPEERMRMRQAARGQAERSFDYRNFTESLKGFLRETHR